MLSSRAKYPPARGRAYDGHGPAAERVLDVFGRSGHRIKRILQDAGNRIVVFGRNDQKTVRRDDPRLQFLYHRRRTKEMPRIEAISTVVPAGASWEAGAKQHGVERCAQETATQSNDAGHNCFIVIL